MHIIKKYISAVICLPILIGLITIANAQTSSKDINESRNSSTRRPQRRGFSLMPLDKQVDSSSFTTTVGGPPQPVIGGGMIGRLTKWTGFTSGNSFIGNSTIFEDKFGLVGIGTDSPTSKLTVMGLIETQGPGGIKFPDGTIQTTSAANAMFSVIHDATLAGNGTLGTPLRLAVPLQLEGSLPTFVPGILTVINHGNAGVAIRGF